MMVGYSLGIMTAAEFDLNPFLLDCQKRGNKGGMNDGLVGGGKNAAGAYESWRWASDNSFAYHALRAAADPLRRPRHGNAEQP